jgi:hypothetical protein
MIASSRAVARIAVAALAAGLPAFAAAETFIEHSTEVRMQLDFHVPDAALAKMLPADFQPVIATAGPAKDANIRMIFIDRIAVTKEDGTPAQSANPEKNLMVYLAVPVKQVSTGVSGQMIVAGLTSNPAEAPGPFGVYLPATTFKVERSVKAGSAAEVMVEENWEFAAASGERMELQLTYERGSGRRATSDVPFYSAKDPTQVQIFKLQQSLDIMWNATVNVRNRVKSVKYKAGGGAIAALFDGTEKMLSVDAIPSYLRAIYKP